MRTHYLSVAAIAASMSLSAPLAANEPDIPKCDKPYGSVALQEPTGGNWWQSYDLENPQALIKYYVNESGCFTLVDRGSGLNMGMSERDLAASGELQVDSNMGGGQLLSADFFLVPDLIADDRDSGGNGIAGALGKKVGGKLGGLLGGVNTTKLEADTILTLVNSRTGVQEVTARGEASKRDLSISL
ncbi:MAG: peptidoglycan-binding protein, partial [Pseudomonadota bacterium]